MFRTDPLRVWVLTCEFAATRSRSGPTDPMVSGGMFVPSSPSAKKLDEGAGDIGIGTAAAAGSGGSSMTGAPAGIGRSRGIGPCWIARAGAASGARIPAGGSGEGWTRAGSADTLSEGATCSGR